MSRRNLIAQLKREVDQVRAQGADRVSLIVINVVNASEDGPHEIVPAGYSCKIGGKVHYFPGNSDQAGAAALALMPRTPGKVQAVPILIACLETPTD
jgi:hypothetical protein